MRLLLSSVSRAAQWLRVQTKLNPPLKKADPSGMLAPATIVPSGLLVDAREPVHRFSNPQLQVWVKEKSGKDFLDFLYLRMERCLDATGRDLRGSL